MKIESFCIVLYCNDKEHDHKQLGKEGYYLPNTCTSYSIVEGSQGRNSRKEPGGQKLRQVRKEHSLLPMTW